MRRPVRRHEAGFSLVEVAISASMLVIAVTMAMVGTAYFMRGISQSDAQDELDIDVQKSMERLKYDLRLSSLDKMFFYPEGAGPYTAISFPMARDDDGDGAIDLDADGKIIWDKTCVYHVWSGEPNQLRLTVFDPRNNSLTDAQRQAQLNAVVTNGNGSATHNGANSSTTVIFQNLFDWTISPRGSTYDGYADTASREVNVELGSIVLTPGPHTFKFTVTGKNSASSGYRIGVDTLVVSPCAGEREAEAQLPVTAQSGAVAAAQYMATGSWSGNYHLQFPATAVGQYFTLTMENDRWEETNFRATGSLRENTAVRFDTTLSPYDFVVCLDGFGYNWYASAQTGDTTGLSGDEALRGTVIRVLVRGQEMLSGGWLGFDGGQCGVGFRAGTGASDHLKITKAYIGQCADSLNPSMDVVGLQKQLKFGGLNGCTLSSGEYRWSDLTDFTIDKDKSYLVSFLVDSASAMADAWKWRELTNPSMPGCYIIPASSNPGTADLEANVWSSRTDVASTNCIYGVWAIYTTYPTNGTFTSSIIDTAQESPVYSDIGWSASVPYQSQLRLKVRSSVNHDMSDAVAWTNIAAMSAAGNINPGSRRYVQFQAEFIPNPSGTSTPRLRDVTVRWVGVERFVDISGSFTKGPDRGIFELAVDGQPLKSGIRVDLEIFKEVRGHRGSRVVTSALTSEVTPRNTGR